MGFEKMNSKVLKVPVGPGREVLARRGAMLGYTGDVRFSPVRSGGGSAGGFLGSQLSGESAAMMVAQGSGEVFYGFQGLTYAIVELSGAEMLTVESNRLLVHDANLNSAIVPLTAQQSGGGFRAGLRSAATGAMTGQGMFTSQLSGVGSVAVLAHGEVLELPVRADKPVVVDPQAFVAARGQVQVSLGANVSFKEARSGEMFQLTATGQGTVYVQASERKF